MLDWNMQNIGLHEYKLYNASQKMPTVLAVE